MPQIQSRVPDRKALAESQAQHPQDTKSVAGMAPQRKATALAGVAPGVQAEIARLVDDFASYVGVDSDDDEEEADYRVSSFLQKHAPDDRACALELLNATLVLAKALKKPPARESLVFAVEQRIKQELGLSLTEPLPATQSAPRSGK